MASIMIPALLALAALADGQPSASASALPQQPVAAVTVGERMARFENLRPGTRTYLRYRVLNGIWRPMDLWRREVRFDEQGGQRRLRIVQTWTGPVGAPSNLEIDSWFEEGTFRPLSHERRTVRAEEVRNEGFLFTPQRVQGLPSTPSNSRAEFSLDTPEPVFNFETDMEMVQTLPLANGYAARLRFYHPGGAPPSDWIFRVTGSARLPFGSAQLDVWVVTMAAAERPDTVVTRFFVAKQGQQVVRVEQPQSTGGMVVKVLIDSGAPAPA
jgi:hypothetical protein